MTSDNPASARDAQTLITAVRSTVGSGLGRSVWLPWGHGISLLGELTIQQYSCRQPAARHPTPADAVDGCSFIFYKLHSCNPSDHLQHDEDHPRSTVVVEPARPRTVPFERCTLLSFSRRPRSRCLLTVRAVRLARRSPNSASVYGLSHSLSVGRRLSGIGPGLSAARFRSQSVCLMWVRVCA